MMKFSLLHLWNISIQRGVQPSQNNDQISDSVNITDITADFASLDQLLINTQN